MSDWNDYFELLLARDDLTAGEWRLAVGLARNLLGFRRREDRLGERLLMKSCGIRDRRTFARVREALVEKGLVVYVPGGKGPGNRSTYRLPLDEPEKRAPERATEESAPPSAQTAKLRAEKRAPERARTKQGKNEDPHGQEERLVQASTETSRASEADPEEALFQQIWDETAEPPRRGCQWEPDA